MRHDEIPVCRIDVHMRDGDSHRIRVALDGLIRIETTDIRRLQKRQKIDIDRRTGGCRCGIEAGNALHVAIIHRRQIDTGVVHETVSEGDALRRVVVARDDEHPQLQRGKLVEEFVEQLDRFRTRNRLVVDITGEDDTAIRLLLTQDRKNLF